MTDTPIAEAGAWPAPADAYAGFAPFYDRFTCDYEHDRWLSRLEELARRHGLRGTRVLDVGCGTGKSLRPLLVMGYDGVGCDVSVAMLRQAAEFLPGVPLFEADMRDLPRGRRYAWVTCIDDAINHLLRDNDLVRALTSMANALEPHGVLTFDINTLMTHRSIFDSTYTIRKDDHIMYLWRGRGRRDGPGEIGTVDITFFEHGYGGWSRTTTRQRERWWSDEEIETAAQAAGLAIVGRYGQREGAIVEPHLDERSHTKVVYFLRHA